jgi:hypothetical protein
MQSDLCKGNQLHPRATSLKHEQSATDNGNHLNTMTIIQRQWKSFKDYESRLETMEII